MSASDVSVSPRRVISGFSFERPEAAGTSHRWWLAATLAALLLRLWGLDSQSLWTDEVESLKLVVQPGADPWYVLTHNFHGPLHKALLYAWSRLFGVGDFAARALSVMIGTATVPLVYLLGRRWVGERVARLAMVLLAVNPFHIYYSQEARGYVLLIALGLVGTWAFLVEVGARSIRSAVGLHLASLGACLASFAGLFMIVVHALLAILAAWRRGYPLGRFVIIQLAVVACLAPYLVEFATTVDAESIVGLVEPSEPRLLRGSHTFSPLAPLHSLYAYSVGLTLGPSINEMHRSLSFTTFRPHFPAIFAAALVFGFAALAGLVRSGRRPELRGVLALWLVVPIVAASILAVMNLKVYNVRYPAVGLLAWVFLVAIGLDALEPRRARFTVAGVMLLLTALSIRGMRHDERYARSDARAAAQLILREGRPGDRILNYAVVEPFRHYYTWLGGGELEVHHLLGWHFRRGRLLPYLDELATCEGRLWVVRQRSWYIDPQAVCKTALDARLEHLGSWHLTDLPVDLYACLDGAFGGESSVRE